MIGLMLSADAEFAAIVRSALAATRRDAITLHRCETLADIEEQLRLNDYAYILLDARLAPLKAVENLAAILSFAPTLPVIVCLGQSAVKPPEKQLQALGAFEIVTATEWPGERLIAALRHAVWFASTRQADARPASGFSEPDRPLLAEVSHEMRSPLNSIIGFAETIEQQALGPWPIQHDRYRDYARHIRNSGEHLLALFEDLLKIGDNDAFAVEMDDEVDPSLLAKGVADMMRPAAAQKNLSLVFEPQPQTQLVRCNGRLLSQALLNLIQNSIKFTNPGGSVIFSVTQEAETCFTVTDTGVGFAPDRLMQPRNSTTGRRPASGHGLGLRFVERVTAAHRGRLQIESRPGIGTEIRLCLLEEALVRPT